MSVLIPAWDGGILTPVEKLEVHRRGLRHKAVSVFVIRDGATLIQQRAAGKYHSPGLWANTCCTHPEWGEDGAACAARRLQQELGIEGLTLTPRPGIEYKARVGPDMIEHEVVEVFTALAPATLTISPDPDEVQATRWVDLSALRRDVAENPDSFTAWMRIYVGDHLDQIVGLAA
ncbi:isopentenyl-diphosphate delta-isomerase [Jannaschia aquimarina]|uniref:Isopentenyl-diphosphate Delta-isomerase n=1 Tax=Jannaschia aquimarina TaxID=935700 RepID=A0A0D1ED98_9RHOB|nr:isopentenyl-diphosphate delta-isomerase [Jannaschia aquimarina]KIT14896.1 Isopentenyl-diphosphate Delta-isomerase [Jannaschia aquimarina]SNS58709.1 isopentenyl-diphosphate delta-isomerase [Jannaschia aquimarina]